MFYRYYYDCCRGPLGEVYYNHRSRAGGGSGRGNAAAPTGQLQNEVIGTRARDSSWLSAVPPRVGNIMLGICRGDFDAAASGLSGFRPLGPRPL